MRTVIDRVQYSMTEEQTCIEADFTHFRYSTSSGLSFLTGASSNPAIGSIARMVCHDVCRRSILLRDAAKLCGYATVPSLLINLCPSIACVRTAAVRRYHFAPLGDMKGDRPVKNLDQDVHSERASRS